MRWRSLLGCESAIAFGDVGGAIAFWMREGDRFLGCKGQSLLGM
ncbi:hypothetical protein [Anabaena sp. AL93]|nr:hypothetical protein [Anabaena sp. AL93]